MKKRLVIKIGVVVVAVMAIISMTLNIVCLNKISGSQKQISEQKEAMNELKEEVSSYDDLWEKQLDVNESVLKALNIIRNILSMEA